MSLNPEKLKMFLQLIDKALEIAEKRKELINTPEFRQFRVDSILKHHRILEPDKPLDAKDIPEEQIDLSFAFDRLEKIIETLEFLKERVPQGLYDEELKRPKGRRPIFGLAHAIGEFGEALGESLYGYELTHALANVERYFDKELD